MGRSAKTEGPQSLREKQSSWTEEGKAEKEPHPPRASPLRTPQPEMLRLRFWRSVPGRGLGLAVCR